MMFDTLKFDGLFKRESSMVLYEDRIITLGTGTYSSVEFDFEKVWGFIRSFKKLASNSFEPDKLHFVHSHPPFFDALSQKDIECMKGLNIAFGFPVNFWISCNNKLKKFKSFDDGIACLSDFWYLPYPSDHVDILKILNLLSKFD